MSSPWNVALHESIVKLDENLWTVEAVLPSLPMRRRMTLIRLTDGSVVVSSAICLSDEAAREVDAWGPVRFIIVPNAWHRIDAPAYAARYPEARVVCPDPARKRVQKVVRVDGNLSLLPEDPALSSAALAGSSIEEHVLTVRSGARASLVFGDSVMNLPPLPGFRGWLYGAIGSTGAPKVTPLMKLVSVRDRARLRAHLGELAETPGLTRVVPGHGSCVEGATEAPAVMRAVSAST